MTFENEVGTARSAIREAEAIEAGRRYTSRMRIIDRLQRGPARTSELARIALRFGARLQELRDEEGYHINCTPVSAGEYEYALVES